MSIHFSQFGILAVCVGLSGLTYAPHTLAALNNNGNGTVTDTATHLIWDRCVLGRSGNDCATGTAASYTWINALLAVNTANANNHLGFQRLALAKHQRTGKFDQN